VRKPEAFKMARLEEGDGVCRQADAWSANGEKLGTNPTGGVCGREHVRDFVYSRVPNFCLTLDSRDRLLDDQNAAMVHEEVIRLFRVATRPSSLRIHRRKAVSEVRFPEADIHHRVLTTLTGLLMDS
jgi:hypothetical protein